MMDALLVVLAVATTVQDAMVAVGVVLIVVQAAEEDVMDAMDVQEDALAALVALDVQADVLDALVVPEAVVTVVQEDVQDHVQIAVHQHAQEVVLEVV